ncbi:unnamed protein product [Blepharisma stoltei]|uniref:Major facilitator superfamily (MFS) profile domain-containing protein n=1 Tax=Blepharisma stoltei TaxID=1481888 RepID=A0AAU9ITT7_9CILI|nr:unnamed protein product [Blepharisma stoltei]
MKKKTIILIGIYTAYFANAIVFTLVIPFASKMVIKFEIADDRSSTGTWVGLMTFSLMFGRTITSACWGSICDRWGRKPVMLIGIASITIFSLLFGFSPNFWWALTSRFLLGVFTPLAIVTKTLISEICPDEEQPSAMALQSMLWQIGLVAGNVLGGVLEDPESSGLIKSGIFADFPFLLPNCVAALIAFLSFWLVYPNLEETLQKTELIGGSSISNTRTSKQIITDPVVCKILSAYTIWANNSTAMNELMVLYLWTDIKYGGFELNPKEIGLFLGASTILIAIFQKNIASFMIKKYGLVRTAKITTFLAIPILLLAPLASLLNRDLVFRWVVLALIQMTWITVNIISFTAISCMSNNSVISQERGRMNGLFMTSASLAKSIAPLLIGFTFTSTVKDGLFFPLNYSFSFYLIAAIEVVMWNICKWLPVSLNQSKEKQGFQLMKHPEDDQTVITNINK